MKLRSVVALLQRGIKRVRLFAQSAKCRRPKLDDGLPGHIVDQPDRGFAGISIDETSQKPRFRLLRKRNLANAMRRSGTNPYREFEDQKTEKHNPEKRVRFELPRDSTMKKKHKSKCMRTFRKHAKRAAEFMAMGVASSAAGYGMPPGFNPSAFRPADQHYEYPEVYSVQQLRWISQYNRNLCTLSSSTVF